MAIPRQQLYATDRLVRRNKKGNVLIIVLFVLFVLAVPTFIGMVVTTIAFNLTSLGLYIGLAVSAIVLSRTLPEFFIRNEALQAVVTVNLLHTLSHDVPDVVSGQVAYNELSPEEQANVDRTYDTFGPGFHLRKPWQRPSAGTNVSLEEASEDFDFTMQAKGGTLRIKGSVRMRPDICRLVPFLSGVAVIAQDVVDLIKAHIIEMLANASIDDALSQVDIWNDRLTTEFGIKQNPDGTIDETAKDPGVSDFEARFGVNIGDVTIAEILPSAEVQKTKNAVEEARVIAEGTAIMLHYKNGRALERAIKKGEVTREEAERARREFMAASENIVMKHDTNEYLVKVEGLDADTVQALKGVLPLLGGAASKPRRRPAPKKGDK